jgi:sialic acid synthase SpsE
MGLNHNGDLDTAIEMVHAAKRAGADALKVQCFSADCFVGSGATWNGEDQRAMFARRELPREAFSAIAEECERAGLVFFGTPDCEEHATWLLGAGTACLKVGSDDLTNTPLISRLATLGKPLLLSTGMAEWADIERAVSIALASPDFGLLYCCSVYPAELWQLRLGQLNRLRRNFWMAVVGFSDHTVGHSAAVAALVLGADMIEKHFTLDHKMPGPDHQWSADPAEFREMVDAIRGIEAVLAMDQTRLCDEEIAMRTTARRSIAAARDLEAGAVVSPLDLAYLRPGDGLPPWYPVVGSTLASSVKQGQQITAADLV